MSEPRGPGSPSWPPRPRQDRETRREVAAAWEARRELGLDFEDEIAAGLADRVEQLAAYRTAELRHETELARTQALEQRSGRTQRFVLGLVSLVAGVPVTGIAAGTDLGLTGAVVGWLGIVGVNAVHAWGSRPRGR